MSTSLDLDLQTRIDTYLMNLRRCLGQLPADDVNDILREIRSHILERAEATGELNDEKIVAILKALGKPEDIAPLYHAEAMVAQARTTFSPTLILRTTLRWATTSIFGLGAFIIGLFGYGVGAALIVSAVMKPLMPERVGAWVGNGGFTIGFAERAGVHDMLGWWLIPVGLVGGALFLILTTRFLRWMLRFAPKRRGTLAPAAVLV